MINLYDVERRMLQAHDDLNKVSRNYRPELLADFGQPQRKLPARMLSGLGVLLMQIGTRLHNRYQPLPTADDACRA